MRKIWSDIKSDRTVKTYVFLREASEYALKRAKENEFWFYDCMSASLYSAFCLEAYLNHLGPLYLGDDWKAIERSGSERRMRMIADRVGYKLDFDSKPFNSFEEIKEYRDSLVHGRTIRLINEDEGYFDYGIEIPEIDYTEWENRTNRESAEKFFEAVDQMIRELHKAAKLPGDPFASGSFGSWKATPKE